MPVTPVIFDCFYENAYNGVHDFDTHTFKCAFTNTTPTAASDAQLTDITEITAGNGYAAGGVTLDNVSVTRTGSTAKVTIDDEVITASGGSIGPFEHFVIYNDTATGDPLVCYITRAEGTTTLSDGESITLDFNATNGVITHGAAA
ncbi:hypothetical protein [Cohaesibacter gelatinilyticus]|uniref:Uncharacterized protein n=1 Tax=Cohaesibacter gelatinilyticus TaxID=372072 RepID=A0A285PJ38_9HYPH|nr:hypothetical protein [Cohaesibacter gelatinilyticus]SNZ21735.1 hypothetical protein SAMN06265368_4860 [Cohaesibacter gelatinilyticus]